jgi:cytochrome c
VRLALVLIVSTAVFDGSAGAQDAADPELGQVLYDNHCGVCHAIDFSRTVFGPHLVGVYGREAGSVSGYRYSYEMRTSGIVWDEETLDALIANPQGLVAGTNMYYRGLPDAANRAHIIAYLKQQSQAE